MTDHSRITVNPMTQQPCIGSYGVPKDVESKVSALIAASRQNSEHSIRKMLPEAKSVATEYASFLCAQYALAAVILTSDTEGEDAGQPLNDAWKIGLFTLSESSISTLHYSASQSNASLLNAGTELASHMVKESDLTSALSIVDQVVKWDTESASEAKVVKAHILQLSGDNSAVQSLESVALSRDPKAFYALGLEQLRRSCLTEAVASFQKGFKAAPEVAELLLGINLAKRVKRPGRRASAHRYVETFCLPEWSASELGTLSKVVRNTLSSQW
jgi:hypothetical protein